MRTSSQSRCPPTGVKSTSAVTDPAVQWLLVDLEAVGDIDPSAAQALTEAIRLAADEDVTFAFSRVRGPIAVLLERYGLTEILGHDRIFATNRAAAAAFEREP